MAAAIASRKSGGFKQKKDPPQHLPSLLTGTPCPYDKSKLGEEKNHYADDQRVKKKKFNKLRVVLGEREVEGFKFSLAPMFFNPFANPHSYLF